ncbi:hypothetical protein CDL12_08414 [Handroanthus impetiginosus]|uniref:DUF4378 domain-containing protein n=1 Tax=Handroanthus impetiginosus TaxID=429701 RepID=A0A2G9HN25_9LAMI|nr:hypothetical protein CDL12_08414 [Handroanthus impetiginosus]
MSSCSSNGFKSFPRRQCHATTVRFLIEIDLKTKQHQKKFPNFNKNPPILLKSPSKSSLSNAFKSVISAVKRLPFGGASSAEKSKLKKSILPRNLSKKILKKSNFWKRKSNHKGMERWKSFDQFLKEDSAPLDVSDSSVMTTMTSDGKSKSWSESDFSVSDECWSGKSSGDVNLNLPEMKNDAVEVVPQNGDVSTTTSSTGSATTNSSTKHEEKEQSSPLSVLDCPFADDDDDEVSSPFQHMEGTKKQLMKKIQRFEYLAQLEPLNLAKRFAALPESDNKNSLTSIYEKLMSNIKEQEQQEKMGNQAAKKALDLLQQMKDTLPSYGLKVKADKLLLDFFTEKIMHSQKQNFGYLFEDELLEEAENWINGRKLCELFLEWEVPRNREVYVKDMEKGGEWRSLDQENKEVALELENVVFDTVLNELLLDISS